MNVELLLPHILVVNGKVVGTFNLLGDAQIEREKLRANGITIEIVRSL